MDSENSSDEGMDHGTSFAAKATGRVLQPLRPLVSKNALTAYLGTFLLLATAVGMIFVSLLAYGVFYWSFIPQIGLERTVYLQFGDGHPWGTTTLDSGLIPSQPYDVHVELELPRTPSNLVAGNFMLDLTLLSQPPTSARTSKNAAPPISHSRRPAILTYTSPLVDISSKVSFMPLYVLGWRRESERLVVRMMEGFQFASGAHNRPESLRLELRSQQEMQIYAAKVTFRTRFTGLRWIMYQWRIPSFFIFTFMFWSVSMFSFSAAWVILTCLFNSRGKKEDEDEVKAEDEATSEATIKEEPFEESTIPETFRAFPSSETQRIKREVESEWEAASSQDTTMTPETGTSEISGAGTARERIEDLGIQPRRSHLFMEEHL
ncbi:putative adipose-regulatory protein-domain-containing protein [Aspergillus cavernicola]|uniref:Adipose-regulatory protein-domain-containing protein n=1 Tax=Aspergillus cavernicola TaxID=176166 RepID=A0ABR4IH07_9EURO